MFSIKLYSQNALLVGTTFGPENHNFLRLEIDQHWKFIRQEYAIQLNNKGQIYIQSKMGIGLNGKRIQLFGYWPFMNFELFKERFNTPMGIELLVKKRKRGDLVFDKPWFPYITLNCDIYKDRVVPMIRLKYAIIK